ncbi:hypothetical protein G6F57_017456 [Rhizopus arrhizus]|nr:hypothetical protein G6F57_017456 [Rhizopus arrhizus]
MGDAEPPGAECRLGLPAGAGADHPLPDVLEDLLGQRTVAQLPQQEPEQPLAMARIQAFERAQVTTGPGQHQGFIGWQCAGFHGVQGKACRRWRIAGGEGGQGRVHGAQGATDSRKNVRAHDSGGGDAQTAPRDCHLSTYAEPAEEPPHEVVLSTALVRALHALLPESAVVRVGWDDPQLGSRLGVRRCAAAAVGGRRGALVRVVGAGPAGDGTGPAAWPPGRADQGAGRGRAPAAGVVPDRRPGRCRP